MIAKRKSVSGSMSESESGIIQTNEVIYKIIDSCQRFVSHVEDNEVISFSLRRHYPHQVLWV